MFTIKENVTNTLIIKNSKFVCCLYKVYQLNDVNKYIDVTKIKYKDATHYCYAYIIDDKKKFSDDSEPGGTAGNPMLQVLEKNNLNFILCIVVRYFGGIKLGAGGLVRAYSKSVSNCLEKVDSIKLINGKNINIIFSYDKINIIDNLLKNSLILKKEFDEEIIYNVNVDNNLLSELNNYAKVIVNNDVYIEKNSD